MHRGLGIVLLGLSATAATIAQAQDDDGLTDAERRAREEYALGSEAFEAERYDEAAEHYQNAYDAQRLPLLLFNMASALDRADRKSEALTRYRAYLAAAPEAENRSYVQSRVTILTDEVEREQREEREREEARRQAAEEDEASSTSETPMSPPPPEPESRSIAGPVVLLALGGASAIAAIITGVKTLSLQSELDSQCTEQVCPESSRGDVDAMGTFALTTDILAGVAGAALLGGVLWLALGGGSNNDDDVALSCGPFGCNVSGHF